MYLLYSSLIALWAYVQVIIAAPNLNIPQRPTLTPGPKHPTSPSPPSPARNLAKVCIVPGGEKNSSASILAAFERCNNGGIVVFPPGETFTVAGPLDLTFLKNIDVAILGTIYMSDDYKYWSTHLFNYAYQNAALFWRFGGEDINIFGLGQGIIDGNLCFPVLKLRTNCD
jgi:galacturan 1,4-alpha-galacturonidase